MDKIQDKEVISQQEGQNILQEKLEPQVQLPLKDSQQVQQQAPALQEQREHFIQNAYNFLTHPSVLQSSDEAKRSFLINKGMSSQEIDEAFKRYSLLPKTSQQPLQPQNQLNPSVNTPQVAKTQLSGQAQSGRKPWERQEDTIVNEAQLPLTEAQLLLRGPQGTLGRDRGVVAAFRRTTWFQLLLGSSALAGIIALLHTYAWPHLYRYISNWLERRRRQRELKEQKYKMLVAIKQSIDQQNKVMGQALNSISDQANKQNVQGQMLVKVIKTQDGINEALNRLNNGAFKTRTESIYKSPQQTPTYSSGYSQEHPNFHTNPYGINHNSRINDPPLNARVADEEPSKLFDKKQNLLDGNLNNKYQKSGQEQSSDIHESYMDPNYEEPKYSLDEVVKMVQSGVTPPNVQTKVNDSPKNQNGYIAVQGQGSVKPWEVNQAPQNSQLRNDSQKDNPNYKINNYSNRQSVSLDGEPTNNYFENGYLSTNYEENQINEGNSSTAQEQRSNSPQQNSLSLNFGQEQASKGNEFNKNSIKVNIDIKDKKPGLNNYTTENEESNFLDNYSSWKPPPLPKSVLPQNNNQIGITASNQ